MNIPARNSFQAAVPSGRHQRILQVFGACSTLGLLLLVSSVPTATAEKPAPFLGAYIHLQQIIPDTKNVAAQEKALVDQVVRFKESGLNVLIPFVVTTGGAAHYNSRIISDCRY